MRIAIIGAGNAGSTCAFMAAETGHKVRLLKTSNHITHDKYFEKLGINTPECNRLIDMCGGLLARDFFKEGRTLTSLGLGELTKEELLHFVEEESITVKQNIAEFI